MCKHETPVAVNCSNSHFGPVTTNLNLCVCNDCGQVFLESYYHDSTYGEERRDRVEPGQTVAGTTFHQLVGDLAREILRMDSSTQVHRLRVQLIGVAKLAELRSERLREAEEALIANPV